MYNTLTKHISRDVCEFTDDTIKDLYQQQDSLAAFNSNLAGYAHT